MNKSKLVSNTQIYLDCRKLLDTILDITPSFPRAYKFSIGNKMHDIGINLISHISAAYMNRERETRIQYLIDFQTDFEVLKTLLRIAGERKWILGKSRHADIIELLDAIGKQSTAWKNSLLKLDSKRDSE
ncbi:four helix bundle protein [uncultured Bacteroides sp.]|uniref:four helix bundle protein n=1 Tax=uncultured Bacteroides sp. TaxID=162156 RepID=UPI0025FE6F0E|nr:four helix bundle protein [uncultured Bacteroides sp.]